MGESSQLRPGHFPTSTPTSTADHAPTPPPKLRKVAAGCEHTLGRRRRGPRDHHAALDATPRTCRSPPRNAPRPPHHTTPTECHPRLNGMAPTPTRLPAHTRSRRARVPASARTAAHAHAHSHARKRAPSHPSTRPPLHNTPPPNSFTEWRTVARVTGARAHGREAGTDAGPARQSLVW